MARVASVDNRHVLDKLYIAWISKFFVRMPHRLHYHKTLWRAGNFALCDSFAVLGCVAFCQINKFLFIYYFYIIDQLSLQPNEMASRIGFGPWAIAWRLLLYSISVMNDSYILLCVIYTYR